MDVSTLMLEGRLDPAATPKPETGLTAKAGVLTEKTDSAIIDLVAPVSIFSRGIRMLVSPITQFKWRGVELVTVRPRDNTANEPLITLDFASHLSMVENAEAARAKLQQTW